ncbi:ABC transporter permease [Lacinutrix sp. Bg11-31]|uniref:ABC transporter permease n=1 Tax=Lacinutrix sp. Bg11-31 TaxID=2057808 RepID=UPI000C312E0E|nr:ABC transporter permease [Lacinutrix sp. Bg11-31]AUC80682.1 ABC transporter permease [Lacinutrix sp. Bg11-31]
MNHLPLIIKREYLTKVRNKAFIVMTFLSPLIMIGLFSLVAYLSQLNNAKQKNITVLDESGQIESIFTDKETVKYTILKNVTLESAKTIVEEQESYGLLYISDFITTVGSFQEDEKRNVDVAFYSEETPSVTIISALEVKVEKRLKELNLEKKGVDQAILKDAEVSITIDQENFTGEKTSKVDSVVKLIFGGAAGYLLFMFIIIYGNMIMRSVIEEKTSRIIEVIISSVKPIQLMLGKIIGTTLAGITQFGIWLILGSILSVIAALVFDIDFSQVNTPQQELVTQAIQNPDGNANMQLFISAFLNMPLANLIIAFILFFVSGYLLYSSLYAAIGAAVDNETDTQQFMLPIIMPLILAVYVGGFTVIEDPHGTVATVFSFIPFTSPVVMLMRIPFGVPIWQQILSLLILIGTFMFTIWMASKIYRVGILMYGKKPTYRELLKWIKY